MFNIWIKLYSTYSVHECQSVNNINKWFFFFFFFFLRKPTKTWSSTNLFAQFGEKEKTQVCVKAHLTPKYCLGKIHPCASSKQFHLSISLSTKCWHFMGFKTILLIINTFHKGHGLLLICVASNPCKHVLKLSCTVKSGKDPHPVWLGRKTHMKHQ